MSHDYRRVKLAALQQLAAGGDQAAARELERRGVAVTAAVDVTTLDYLALRQLVLAWRDGITADERDRNRALAERAQTELGVRYQVDRRLYERDGQGRAPQPPPPAPWQHPRAPRTAPWKRPQGSTMYPAESARRGAGR